ncbi:hypothetical protein ABZX85_47660 [Streptomyces sp. NPDC004539]|uniref:hypothetical protein n=1 Tax=Streptomyces sp. NPDC004539 TaxID=3154280 RepID=UPI0033BC3402
MSMSDLYDIKIGRRVRHVDDPARDAGVVREFCPYRLFVKVDWGETPREPITATALLTPAFDTVTVRQVSDGRGRVLRAVACVSADPEGERVVIEKWLTPGTNGA